VDSLRRLAKEGKGAVYALNIKGGKSKAIPPVATSKETLRLSGGGWTGRSSEVLILFAQPASRRKEEDALISSSLEESSPSRT